MRTRRLAHRLPLATLAACVGLCLAGLRSADGASRASAPADEVRAVELGELHAEPAQWLGRRVRFAFQHHSLPEAWNPCLTRFGSQDYRAALAWSDDQLLWLLEEHDAPQALLFARRGTQPEAALESARTYARFEAVGHVRQVFLGRPWIELESLERLPEEVGEGAILHASRALGSMRERSWQLAREDLARARASNLPPHARQALERLDAECEAAQAALRQPSGRRR